MTARLSVCSHALGLLLLASPLASADRFELRHQPLVIPERGTVTSTVIVAEQYEFSFVPPTGWRYEFDAKGRKITFFCYESNAAIGLRIVSRVNPAPDPLDRGALRRRVLGQFPGARIRAECDCYASDGSGPAFDLEETRANRPKWVRRLAFVPFPGGVLEFSLFAGPSEFDRFLESFGELLTSFRVRAIGRASR
ncbi:MAG: hypothetical protein KGS61_02630 [Verrucomicrobia bacterium]|nr:hypothetical protein [Verrucomicrobiota bacterium]